MQQRELVIIGAGPGGYVAAIKAAQLGIACTLIESRDIGGTCLNRGCVPTKSILHSAEIYTQAKEAERFGVKVRDVSLDFVGIRNRAHEVVGQIRQSVEALLEANGIELIAGRAKVAPGPVVHVESHEGASLSFEAKDVIIATGSQPARPPIPGLEGPRVLTSDELLADVPEFKHLIIIGGGVIGVEFASAYASMGVQVSILEAMPRLLPTLDRELGQSLALSLKKRGCAINTGAMVKEINTQTDSVKVTFELKGELQDIEGDAVLISTGRSCDVEAICADGLALECERGRIVVDNNMQTSVEHIYAIGDIAAGMPQLAHAASSQGIAAALAIKGLPTEQVLSCVPSCVYTDPEIASVGMSEAEAKEAGLNPRVAKYLMTGNGKTVIAGLDRGFIKVIADENDRVIGAQMLCGRATDMIGEIALGVAHGLSAKEMAAVIRAHPSFEEGIGEAFEALVGESIHAMPKSRKARA